MLAVDVALEVVDLNLQEEYLAYFEAPMKSLETMEEAGMAIHLQAYEARVAAAPALDFVTYLVESMELGGLGA